MCFLEYNKHIILVRVAWRVSSHFFGKTNLLTMFWLHGCFMVSKIVSRFYCMLLLPANLAKLKGSSCWFLHNKNSNKKHRYSIKLSTWHVISIIIIFFYKTCYSMWVMLSFSFSLWRIWCCCCHCWCWLTWWPCRWASWAPAGSRRGPGSPPLRCQ